MVAMKIILLCNILTGGVDAMSMMNGKEVNRRDIVVSGARGFAAVAAATVGGGGFLLPDSVLAAATGEKGTPPVIAVIGASGRTGALCVASCLQKKIPVRALTRDGTWTAPAAQPDVFSSLYGLDEHTLSAKNNPLLTVASCDVRDPASIASGVDGCSCVIYAASASKKGGNPNLIDNVGVVATAEACLQANVQQYIVVSSTATTRPKSLGYIFTDLSVNGIMTEKRKGEDGVKVAYNDYNSNNKEALSYAILRPGGLEESKKNIILGPSALEFSQGDVFAGVLSRADLAEAAVALALQKNNDSIVQNASFELYYTDSAIPVEKRFKSLLNKEPKSEQHNMSDFVRRVHGTSYDELFRDIQSDGNYYVPI